MADEISESTSELLRKLRRNQNENAAPFAEWDAQVKLFARTQYTFYVAFQALVLVLALAVATALVISIIRLLDGVDVAEIVLLLGSVATGIAAGFLQKQASEAHGRYKDAQNALRVPNNVVSGPPQQ